MLMLHQLGKMHLQKAIKELNQLHIIMKLNKKLQLLVKDLALPDCWLYYLVLLSATVQ
ncbi:hypothetical protein P3S68_027861 [Capsicum galapagoense]